MLPPMLYNALVIRVRHVEHGSDLKINGKIFFVSNSPDGIIIGNDVRINSCRKANPIGGDTRTVLFAKGNGKIRIGDGCRISNSTLFACESITLGEHVFLGGSVKIYDSDFHDLNYTQRVNGGAGVSKPVMVKDGAFIGAHTLILKGVTIGEKSIIGAGSVVTCSIPANEVWAGNPARFIKIAEEL